MPKDIFANSDPVSQDSPHPVSGDVEAISGLEDTQINNVDELVLGVGASAVNDEVEDAEQAFINGSKKLFDKEHTLAAPPKPVSADYIGHTTISSVPITTSTTTRPLEHYSPPTIEEQIANLENGTNYPKESERSKYFERQRENFGQTYKMIIQFGLITEDYSSRYRRSKDPSKEKEIDPVLEVDLANRVSLYRYLQQRGLVIIDDSGLSSHAHDSSQRDHDKGSLFLPESIDREDFFAFEDEIRARFPFDYIEMYLASLKVERDEHRKPEPSEFRAEEDAMRELVDFLATDERFVTMFEQAESLRAARRENRRAQIDVDQQR